MIEWKVLERIDPWGQTREDYRNAHLMAHLANLLGRGRDQEPYKTEDFLLAFKDKTHESEGQTTEQIEGMIKTWVAAANIVHRQKLTTAPKS